MMSDNGISIKELTYLNVNQKKHIHSVNSGKAIINNFKDEYTPSTWGSSKLITLDCKKYENILNYEVNNNNHFLYYTRILYSTPRFKVKNKFLDKVKISLIRNSEYSIFKNITFIDDNVKFQSFDPCCYDIKKQYYRTTSENNDVIFEFLKNNKNIWSNNIEPININKNLKFFFSDEPSGKSFPIHFKNNKNTAYITCILEDNIFSKILRVKIFNSVSEKWVNISDTDYKIEDFVNISDTKSIFQPHIMGRYFFVAPNEISWHLKCNIEEEYIKKIYVYDFIDCSIELKSFTYGDEVRVTLNSKGYPCVAIFWMAENLNLKKNNFHSKYLSDKNEVPIFKSSLKYFDEYKFKDLKYSSFEAESEMHFKTKPYNKGYHAYSIALKTNESYVGESGVVFDENGIGGELVLNMLETNFEVTDIESLEKNFQGNQRSNDRFKIITKLLILKTICLQKRKDGVYQYVDTVKITENKE